MTKEGIYEFTGVEIRGDMVVLTDPDYCILKFTGLEVQWFTNQRTETVRL